MSKVISKPTKKEKLVKKTLYLTPQSVKWLNVQDKYSKSLDSVIRLLIMRYGYIDFQDLTLLAFGNQEHLELPEKSQNKIAEQSKNKTNISNKNLANTTSKKDSKKPKAVKTDNSNVQPIPPADKFIKANNNVSPSKTGTKSFLVNNPEADKSWQQMLNNEYGQK